LLRVFPKFLNSSKSKFYDEKGEAKLSMTKLLSVILATLLFTTIIPFMDFRAYGSPTAKMYVNPPEIIDSTLVPPKTFDVNVTLENVEDLYGYEFNMSYDSNILTCLYVIINDILDETSYTAETLINNAKGFVWVKVDYCSPAVPITTSTPVDAATIHFRVKTAGASVLDLHDTDLTNATGAPILHDVSDGFVMTVIHDVAVTAVAPSSSWAYEGWLLNITVTARNYGNATETFDVSTYFNDTLIGMIPVVDLPSNEERTLVFTWNTTGLTSSNYTISSNASLVPFELNTTNNVFVDGIVELLALTMMRDVAVTNVTPEVTWAYQGWIVNITVKAENLGETIETFNVTAYYDNVTIGMVTLENMLPHTGVNLTFVLNTSSLLPCHYYLIRAVASFVLYEYNVTNNAYTDGTVKIRIVGDLNGDGKVDITDLAMVSAAFGSYPGHPRWNPAADINRDNRVDIQDVAKVSANFGKTCL